jgi:hypothetical protein
LTGCGKTSQACHSDPALREKKLGSLKITQLWRGFSFELIVGEVPARVEPAEIGLVPFLGLDKPNH